jgi:hypothetical protein
MLHVRVLILAQLQLCTAALTPCLEQCSLTYKKQASLEGSLLHSCCTDGRHHSRNTIPHHVNCKHKQHYQLLCSNNPSIPEIVFSQLYRSTQDPPLQRILQLTSSTTESCTQQKLCTQQQHNSPQLLHLSILPPQLKCATHTPILTVTSQ